jgi:hypothetical protein
MASLSAPLRGEAALHEEIPRFALEPLAGRLIELRGAGAALTCAFGLVIEAQRGGEPVAYICGAGSCFFPPDAAQGGADLDALVVVRTGNAASRARAADELARSGAFALLVVDLSDDPGRIPPALLSRLLGLAQKHRTAIVFLSADEGDAAGSAIGPLVSLRAVARHAPLDLTSSSEPRHRVSLEVIKDKRRAPGWTHEELCLAPVGLA